MIDDSEEIKRVDEVVLKKRGGEDKMYCTVKFDSTALIIRPLVPFQFGESYFLNIGVKEYQIDIPESTKERPTISSVFPNSRFIPSNTLKFRFHFSQPMSRLNSDNYITVIKNGSKKQDYPFLPLESEMWNEENTELTLWLDPGRIKEGLLSSETEGNYLNEGDEITLNVSAKWKDEEGNALVKEYNFSYDIGGADINRPDPSGWDVFFPKSRTKDPLSLMLDEEYDTEILKSCLVVNGNSGPVEGRWLVMKHGKAVFFYPLNTWQESEYFIEVCPNLEDLAGNNLTRLFDKDLMAESIDSIQSQVKFMPSPN